jgi:hypothetical protein
MAFCNNCALEQGVTGRNACPTLRQSKTDILVCYLLLRFDALRSSLSNCILRINYRSTLKAFDSLAFLWHF